MKHGRSGLYCFQKGRAITVQSDLVCKLFRLTAQWASVVRMRRERGMMVATGVGMSQVGGVLLLLIKDAVTTWFWQGAHQGHSVLRRPAEVRG